jgi:hypothetical protein
MPGEGHLEGRRDDAYAGRRSRGRCRKAEGGLRQVELKRERLHRRVVERARVLEDAQRVAREPVPRRGEHVEDAKHQVDRGCLRGVGLHGWLSRETAAAAALHLQRSGFVRLRRT